MIEPRSEEWYAQRRGKATASRMADLMARTKTGWGASRANYMAELLLERLTGTTAEGYINSAMQWGIDMEPRGRATYELLTDNRVELTDFVDHPRIPMSGASPDGLIGADGLIELKCPNTAQHLEALLDASVPGKYLSQVQWQLACTGRRWCDWVSYDPRMPAEMQIVVRRITRDDYIIGELELHVRDFLAELDNKIAELRKRYGRRT